eukprot:TRINITY_DN10042_c0_g1_i1.p1 TRINITY_DN10042_c0_g1~~TRINITY_DN10042_c0_g1_i1.p1  ORF type:complete len:131 (+),score=0.61 TRINITY_DN10042_c0_g1_i1:137-529(+)
MIATSCGINILITSTTQKEGIGEVPCAEDEGGRRARHVMQVRSIKRNFGERVLQASHMSASKICGLCDSPEVSLFQFSSPSKPVTVYVMANGAVDTRILPTMTKSEPLMSPSTGSLMPIFKSLTQCAREL